MPLTLAVACREFLDHCRVGKSLAANTLRALPAQINRYDSITKEAVDPYLSARSAYSQSRAEAIKK